MLPPLYVYNSIHLQYDATYIGVHTHALVYFTLVMACGAVVPFYIEMTQLIYVLLWSPGTLMGNCFKTCLCLKSYHVCPDLKTNEYLKKEYFFKYSWSYFTHMIRLNSVMMILWAGFRCQHLAYAIRPGKT
jgi:hypothetical protein